MNPVDSSRPSRSSPYRVPQGSRGQGEPQLPPKRGEFEDAVIFVTKIKERFRNDEHVYKTFLEILNMYKKGDKDIDEVYNEVASLFEGHPDLISDYRQFF